MESTLRVWCLAAMLPSGLLQNENATPIIRDVCRDRAARGWVGNGRDSRERNHYPKTLWGNVCCRWKPSPQLACGSLSMNV